MSDALLTAQGIRKRIHDGDRVTTILDGVDLELAVGERVALIGPSGSGKSSLLHILGGLDPDYQGTIRFQGQELSALDDDALSDFRNRTLGFVFQSYNLLGHLTAIENVMLPARFSPGEPDDDRAMEMLVRVGLGPRLQQRPHTLSGGERQRVAIARALYHRPKLVLCDEPTGNLDRQTARDILALFHKLSEEGVGLLIATHDADIAHTAARVLSLREGRLV